MTKKQSRLIIILHMLRRDLHRGKKHYLLPKCGLKCMRMRLDQPEVKGEGAITSKGLNAWYW